MKNPTMQPNPYKKTALFIFLFTLVPFVALSFYNVPLGDDFWYAEKFQRLGFWGTQTNFWYKWSGRYISSAVISGLNPVSYGHYFGLAFIHPLLLLGGTAWALWLLVRKSVRFFGLLVDANLLFVLLFFFYLNYIPDCGESFYWLAGAATYQLPVVFFLLYLHALIGLFESDKIGPMLRNQIVAFVCLFIILGSSEVIVVYANIVNGLVLLWLFARKNYVNRFLPIFIFTAIISFLMITAPGNFARGGQFVHGDFHLAKALFQSFARSFFVMVFWIASLVLILLCLPNAGESAPEKIPVDKVMAFFRKPKFLLVSALFFLLGLTVLGFFPSVYATNWIPQRAYTPIFFSFMLMGSLLLVVFGNRFEMFSIANRFLSEKRVGVLLLPLLVMGLSHNSNVMNAYVDLTSGKASSYHKQVVSTYKILSVTKKDTIQIPEIAKKPLILPYRWVGGTRLVNSEWEDYFHVQDIQDYH